MKGASMAGLPGRRAIEWIVAPGGGFPGFWSRATSLIPDQKEPNASAAFLRGRRMMFASMALKSSPDNAWIVHKPRRIHRGVHWHYSAPAQGECQDERSDRVFKPPLDRLVRTMPAGSRPRRCICRSAGGVPITALAGKHGTGALRRG